MGEGEGVGVGAVEGRGTAGFSGVSYQLSQRLAGQPRQGGQVNPSKCVLGLRRKPQTLPPRND